MKFRPIMIPVDDLWRLFVDYLQNSNGFPYDGKIDRMRRHGDHICLRVIADSFNGKEPDEEIFFDLRKVHLVS